MSSKLVNKENQQLDSPYSLLNRDETPLLETTRLSLEQSELSNFPFQLLPGVVHETDVHEKTLSWQHQESLQFSVIPRFQVVLFIESLADLGLQLSSLEVQSWSKFSIHLFCSKHIDLVKIEEILAERTFSFALYQFDLEVSYIESLKSVVEVLETDFVFVLGPGDILHPQALYVLAKEIVSRPCELLYFNEIHPGSKNSYLRKLHSDKYSSIGNNWVGSSYFLEKEFLVRALSYLDSNSVDSNFRSFAFSWFLSVFVDVSKKHFVPLALVSVEKQKEELQSGELKALEKCFSKHYHISFTSFSHDSENGILAIPKSCGGAIQVVIPFKNQSDLTISAIRSLSKQDCRTDLEVVLVNNESVAEELATVQEFVAGVNDFSSIEVINLKGHFNFARINNIASRSSRSPFILFMNNDVEVTSSAALSEMRSFCGLDDVGVVGGRLYYDNQTVQSSGINFAAIRPLNVSSDEMFAGVLREVDGVSFAMALVSRDAWNSIGGLDELRCPNGFGDALFCNSLVERGYRCILHPGAKALHHESVSRGISVEDIELFDMAQSGLDIASEYEQFHALRQPAYVPLAAGVHSSANFDKLVGRLRGSERLIKPLEKIATSLVAVHKRFFK